MNELAHGASLLSTLAAVTRIARSLYGPGKARKQVTDVHGATQFTSDAYEIMETLSSEHVVLAMLHESLHEHMRVFGTRCTTLLNVTNVLAEAAVELQRRGVPVDAIRDALVRAERTCLQTFKSMRLPLAEAISGFAGASRETQLWLLGERLQTLPSAHVSDHDRPALPMRLALAMLTDIDSRVLLDAAFSVDSTVSTRVALGGVSSQEASGSRVFSGVLVPVDSEHSARIRHWFAHEHPGSSNKSECVATSSPVVRGVVTINGDFDISSLEACPPYASMCFEGVQVVFVHGDVDSKVMDHCWQVKSAAAPAGARRHTLQCIPVDSHKELRRVAELSGAQIIDSWMELLPSAIGNTPIQLRVVEVSATRLGHDDDDNDDAADSGKGTRVYAQLFVHVDRVEQSSSPPPPPPPRPLKTLLVRGATRSDANELEQSVRKSLHRVVHALRFGHLLPSSGAYLCACAAELRLEMQRLDSAKCADASSDAVALAMERLVAALSELAVVLVRNTGEAVRELRGAESGSGADFFAHLAAVRRVQSNYIQGIDDVGRTKFYASCHFNGADFCALMAAAPPSSRRARLDDYHSVRSAFQRSFQLLDLVLSVASYRINARPGAS